MYPFTISYYIIPYSTHKFNKINFLFSLHFRCINIGQFDRATRTIRESFAL